MKLTYEELNRTMEKGGVQAGVELIVFSLLAANKVKLTDKGRREFSVWLTEYSEKKYGFTPQTLVLFGLKKQEWLMELIREAMLSPEMLDKLNIK